MKRPAIKGRGAEIFLERNAEEDQPTVTPVAQEVSIPVTQRNGIPGHHSAGQPSPQLDDKPVELVKATFYLTPTAIDNLDDFWFQLRKKTRRQIRVSKSQIVSHVLERSIRDLKDESSEKIIEFFK